ncbi:DUF1217 domain-containing protein [Jannaschia donghaensis]|uniref:Flagellar protein n=1 Tax=Jannaschia donghaensis TaxID=420998 RepID=A0A0M6YJ66_9RHOB|nr:DUF1217 domain-containing protein [Jannaschia donghaensis]CTQ49106.1 hypothetical protein JDO7802_01116 [Jannaschia donghaensis]
MTFQPFVPVGGLAGWRFLQNTIETQRSAHGASPVLERDLEYFRENIGKITTAEELVGDFRLLSVALGAFGLSEDINSKFLIKRVLEEGTIETDALANRLSDKRYRDLSRAFGFGDFPVANTALSDFPDRIADRYKEQRFEIDMGQTNETMRLALNAQRELPSIASGDTSNRTKWFTVMGTAAVREVMETALNLPSAIATLSIDKQLDVFLERSEALFGTNDLSKLAQGDTLSRLLDRFTALDQSTSGSNVTSPALILLRGF